MAQDAQINQLVNDKKKLNNKFNKLNEFDDSNKIARPKIIIEDDSIIVIEADDLKTKIVSSENNKSKCHICGKLTKNLHKHLIYHEKIKKNIDQLKCKYCTKTFAYKSYLKKHEACHENKRNFECENCNKKFILKKDLKQHNEYHCHKD